MPDFYTYRKSSQPTPAHIGMLIERPRTQGHGEEYLSAGSVLATETPSAGFCFTLRVGQTSKYRCFSADMAILAEPTPTLTQLNDFVLLMFQS